MTGPNSLAQLPSHILNAITRLLQFTDAYRLGKLSGDVTLWTKFRLGGYTELICTTEEAFLRLRPLLPTFDFMPNMTHLVMETDNDANTMAPLEPLWAHRLPKTLLEIRLRCSDSLRVWLRPLDPARDDDHAMHVASVEHYTPMSMQEYFPNLRSLVLLGMQPDARQTKWDEGAIRRFVHDLPPSLTDLRIPDLMGSIEQGTIVAPSAEILQNLDVWHWGIPTESLPAFASLFGCSHKLNKKLSKSEIETMVQSIIHVRSLGFMTAVLDVNLFSFLCALSNLQTLRLPLIQSTPDNMVHFAKAKLPTSLTELIILLPPAAPFEALLAPLVNLTSLELTVADSIEEDPTDMLYFKLALPPALKKLEVQIECEVPLYPLLDIPLSVTRIVIESALPTIWPINTFEKASALRSLRLSNVPLFEPYRAAGLPPSLTKLETNDNHMTLINLSELPKSITDLNVTLSIDPSEYDNFIGISSFTHEGISKWLREQKSVLISTGLGQEPKRVEAPFVHLERLELIAVSVFPGDALGLKIRDTVKEIEMPDTQISDFFQTLPEKALTSLIAPQEVCTLQELPPTLEKLELMTISTDGEEHIDPTLPMHQAPALLKSLKLTAPTAVFDVHTSEPLLYPVLPNTLPHLETLHLHAISPTHAKALHLLPSSIAELHLGFRLRINQFYDEEEEEDEDLNEEDRHPEPSLMDLPRDWLPKLKKLFFYKGVLAFRDWIHRFPSFELLQVDRFYVHSDAFVQVPESMTQVTEESLKSLFLNLLPYRARIKSNIGLEYEWNAESLGKLPKSMKELRLRKGTGGMMQEEKRDLSRHLPPNLESLYLLSYFEQHFTDTSVMPRSITMLALMVDKIDAQQLIAKMPPRLKELILFRTNDDEVEFTVDMALALPRTLLVLNTDMVVKEKAVLEALPRGLRSLAIQDAPLDKKPFRLALPPLVLIKLSAEEDAATIRQLTPKLLKDIPSLLYLAGQEVQNCLVDKLSPCYSHHPAHLHPS